MPTFTIRYQGFVSLNATSQQEAFNRFQGLPTSQKGANLYNVHAYQMLHTRYAGEIESNELIALCYKGILVFHVVADYDSGPDLWSIRRDYFSWTAEEINEERDLGNQFAITSHPVPDFYLPAPREYVSNDLEPDVTTIRELCWLIDEELAKTDGHQRCKHPYTTENTSR